MYGNNLSPFCCNNVQYPTVTEYIITINCTVHTVLVNQLIVWYIIEASCIIKKSS